MYIHIKKRKKNYWKPKVKRRILIEKNQYLKDKKNKQNKYKNLVEINYAVEKMNDSEKNE